MDGGISDQDKHSKAGETGGERVSVDGGSEESGLGSGGSAESGEDESARLERTGEARLFAADAGEKSGKNDRDECGNVLDPSGNEPDGSSTAGSGDAIGDCDSNEYKWVNHEKGLRVKMFEWGGLDHRALGGEPDRHGDAGAGGNHAAAVGSGDCGITKCESDVGGGVGHPDGDASGVVAGGYGVGLRAINQTFAGGLESWKR